MSKDMCGFEDARGNVERPDEKRYNGAYSAFCLCFVVMVSLVPVLSVPIPPMTDYPNHYVRMWLLIGGIERPHMATFYEIDWNVAWTNIAIDLIAVALGKIATIETIGPIILALGLLLAPLGVVLLNRKIFGHVHWWQILSFALGWNAVFLLGFISFSISLGVALICAYVDECLRSKNAFLLLCSRVMSSALLLVAHPFGLLFYATLLAALRFGPTIAPLRSKKAFLSAFKRIAVAVSPIFIPLIAFLVLGPSLPGNRDVSLFQSMYWENPSILRSITLLITYFRTYDVRFDIVFMMIFYIVIREASHRRLIRVHWGLLLASFVTGLISLFVPTVVYETAAIDVRLPCMMVLAAIVGVRPDAMPQFRSFMMPFAIVVVSLRVAFIEYVWLQRADDVASVERVLAHIEPGSLVLPSVAGFEHQQRSLRSIGQVVGGLYPSFLHYPSLVSLRRDAYMPFMFAAAGKQPLRVRDSWAEYDGLQGQPVSFRMLQGPTPSFAPYLKNWRTRFDYLLVLNANIINPKTPMPTFGNVRLIADEGFARLYRIDRQSSNPR